MRGESLEIVPTPLVVEATQRPRFDEFAERWFENYVRANCKPSDQRSKRTILDAHLVPAFGSLLLGEISTELVEQYKRSRLSLHRSAKTVNNEICVLSKCLRCALEWKELDALPLIRLLRVGPQPFRVLTKDESERLLATEPNSMWNLMAHLALRTGMRRGELRALDWSDIDFERNRVTVSRSISVTTVTPTKTYQTRSIPLARDIRARLEPVASSSGLVFSDTQGTILTEWALENAIRRLTSLAHVPNVRWHALRHTFATELAANGVPLHVIKELLGHSTITMTLRYAHAAPSLLDAAIRTLEPSTSVRPFGNFGQPVGTEMPQQIVALHLATAAPS